MADHIPFNLLNDVGKLASGQKLTGKGLAKKGSTRTQTFSSAVTAPLPVFSSARPPAAPPYEEQSRSPALRPKQSRVKPPPPAIPPLTTIPPNAFLHPNTSKRVAHLKPDQTVHFGKSADTPEGMAFVYDTSTRNREIELEATEDGQSETWSADGSEAIPDPIEHDDLNIVIPNTELLPDSAAYREGVEEAYPSLKPATRKEVVLLKHTMLALLKEIGADIDQEYPTEMHAFLSVIQEEQKIYDAVFQELIRQVSVNMMERGEVLAEIRRRYSTMFMRIPKHVRQLHTELVAHRKLNRRLSEELIRSKETVADLMKELDLVRKHDAEVTKQAQDAQEKLVVVLSQSDNTDEILEEYHRLYRMQRTRLEDAVRLIEQEKRIWVDAATSLALRIGQDHGVTELMALQKHENSRLRATNHMIVIISDTNDHEINTIASKVDEWRDKLVSLSQNVVEEDQRNVETLARMQRDMSMVLKNLNANEPMDAIESDHPLLKVFHLYDAKNLSECLKKWVDQISLVAVRFTSDRDLVFQEDIVKIRKLTETWIDCGLKLLKRNERNTNGKDYIPLTETLQRVHHEIDEWLVKIDMRISGEDGIAAQVISLQNQLEDRYTTYSARDPEKPLPSSERIQLKESLNQWIEHIGTIIELISNTAEKEQQKIPLHVENWLSRVLDQLNTDTDIRNEENVKIHTSMISWMVHLLVKGGREKPSESWDYEFHQLNQELIAFNMNLTKDSADIEMVSVDRKPLRALVREHCDNWILVAKKLLSHEKKVATEHHKPKKSSTAAEVRLSTTNLAQNDRAPASNEPSAAEKPSTSVP